MTSPSRCSTSRGRPCGSGSRLRPTSPCTATRSGSQSSRRTRRRRRPASRGCRRPSRISRTDQGGHLPVSLRIQNNVEAFNAHRNLVGTSAQLSKSMERLSSGYRINRAADDSAGLAISEKLRAQIGGLQQAQRNGQDAISLVQTAEGAMQEVHAMLQRVRDLAIQFNNGTLSGSDKAAITAEVSQLSAEISRISTQTKFNGNLLLNGGTMTFQI